MSGVFDLRRQAAHSMAERTLKHCRWQHLSFRSQQTSWLASGLDRRTTDFTSKWRAKGYCNAFVLMFPACRKNTEDPEKYKDEEKTERNKKERKYKICLLEVTATRFVFDSDVMTNHFTTLGSQREEQSQERTNIESSSTTFVDFNNTIMLTR